MTFHIPSFPHHMPQDKRQQWDNTPSQYHTSLTGPNPFDGFPAMSPDTTWYPGMIPLDSGCPWSSQYVSTVDAYTSSPSSEWQSCQTLPSSSAWTSPQQSPGSANDFLHMTTSAGLSATHVLPAPVSGEHSFIHDLHPQDEFAYADAQQHTPRAHEPSQMMALPVRPPASSRPLSASTIYQPAMLPIMYGQFGSDNNLHGLGLISTPDQSHLQAVKQKRSLKTTQPNAKPPRKRRTLGKQHPLAAQPPKKQFPCAKCNASFARQSNLTTHLKLHGITKPIMVRCSEPSCLRIYGRRSDANRHAKSTHKGESFQCEMCSKSFKRHDLQLKHLQHGCVGRK